MRGWRYKQTKGILKYMKKELLKYRVLMPSHIEVETHQAEEGGFWAKVKTFPGVIAQGEDILDLVEMINIAIHDYLEIPQRLRKFLGRYEPQLNENELRKIVENYRHKQIEDTISKIIQSHRILRFNKVAV